ncbi:MAG: type II toxin-antitoxin system VapC family toxin [Terracidiphilus sp.]
MRAVVDTCILVDYLRGFAQARAELALYQSSAISVISWMEVMAGATPQTENTARAFLQSFDLLEIDAKTAEVAVILRKTKHIKLPDAIIWATAQVHQCLLVTRNTRDFDRNEPGVRVPYTL